MGGSSGRHGEMDGVLEFGRCYQPRCVSSSLSYNLQLADKHASCQLWMRGSLLPTLRFTRAKSDVLTNSSATYSVRQRRVKRRFPCSSSAFASFVRMGASCVRYEPVRIVILLGLTLSSDSTAVLAVYSKHSIVFITVKGLH